MMIMGQDKDIAISTDCFVSFNCETREYSQLDESYYVITAIRDNDSTSTNCVELAYYNNGDFAQAQFERMIDAWSKGERYFKLPLEE